MKLSPLQTLPLRLRLRVAVGYHRWRAAHPRVRTHYRSDFVHGTVTPTIHPYPGLGHQLASMISAYLWARDLGLDFRPAELQADVNGLFDFGEVGGLRSRRPKRLPYVPDERDRRSLLILRDSLARSKRSATTRGFRFSLDQFRWDQTPADTFVRSALQSGRFGVDLEELERTDYVAVHIRRGDVEAVSTGRGTGLSRWVDVGWYIKLLRQLADTGVIRDLPIYVLLSGGSEEDRDAFRRADLPGLTLVTEGTVETDFIRLAGARLLISAPSSFSFTAGLASRGAVIARHPWWHFVPDRDRWFRIDSSFESLDVDRLFHYVKGAG